MWRVDYPYQPEFDLTGSRAVREVAVNEELASLWMDRMASV